VSKRNSGSALDVSSIPSPDQVRAQLDKMVASRLFARSERLCRFLRFCAELALDGKSDSLKEQLVGVEVFDRGSDYDPRTDPIVRVEARRLRAKLKAYYTSSGRSDCLLIDVPKGAYVPAFRMRNVTQPSASQSRTPQTRSQATPSTPGERSIAVLPFTNLTPDAGADYFSDGLTEELIYLLTRIPSLRVVAWTSMSQMRGREQDLTGIGQELKVATVLRGSVRRTTSRVRVTAQLIDTESGNYLWSEAYDRQLENVVAIQEEMARAIVDTLQLTLAWRGGEAVRKTPNLKCYNLCLQGRFHANKRTPEGLRQSVLCFEQAVAADKSSADAYAGLACGYSLMADYGVVNPYDVIPKAKVAAEKALSLDAQSSDAHISRAFVLSTFEWDWHGAGFYYRRAIELNPGLSRAHHWYATDYLALVGRFDEAEREADIARHLDPLSPLMLEGCGYVQMLRRDYPAALKLYQQLAELDPVFWKAYSALGRVLSLLGRYDEAIASLERARALAGDVPSVLAATAQTLGAAGFTWEARALVDRLHEIHQNRWVPSSCFAIAMMGLGDYQAALSHLETSCEKREQAVSGLKVHPLFDPLRSEPRFQRLLERIGLLP
jgi:TolB-like protein/Flp pilus assembly protein TadD